MADEPIGGNAGSGEGEVGPPDEPSFDEVEEASADSFPASDPPSWTHLVAGPPERPDDGPGRPAGAAASAQSQGPPDAAAPPARSPDTPATEPAVVPQREPEP